MLERAEAAVRDHDAAEARRDLGTLYYVDDRFEDSQQQLEIAFRMFRDSGQPREAARVAISLAGLHSSLFGRFAVGSGWIERARMLLERVGPCVEWGYLELALIACERTDVEDLLASADRALTIAVEFNDVDLETQAMADGGLALITQGRTKEGFARLDGALAAITAGEVTPLVAGICFCSMLTACDRTGDLRRAQEWTAIIAGMIKDSGNRPRILHTHCRVAYGSVLHAAGRWREAEASMLEALGPVDAPIRAHRELTVAHLAGLRVEQGRIEEAAELLAPFEDRVTSCAPLAQVHLRRGQPDLAVAVLHRGLRELVADALRIGPLLSLLVDAELQRGDVVAASEAADRLERMASDADVDSLVVDALAARARVLASSGDDAGAIVCLENAIIKHGSDERPLLLATLRLELAEALARSGDHAAAISEGRAALACFERLGADPNRDRTAALLRSLGDTSRARPQRPDEVTSALSVREQEVLELVSLGLSNAEIASRLFISPKTAEHHVGRILTKLGVRNRGEAAALAVRLAAANPE